MADAVAARIKAAGGDLTVWAVLREDVHETRYGDGFYLHLRGAALNARTLRLSPPWPVMTNG